MRWNTTQYAVACGVLSLLCVVLAACGDDDVGSDVPSDGVDIPVSQGVDSVSNDAKAIVGVVFDLVTGENLPDAVVTSAPASEVVRTTALGEFVLQKDIVPDQEYTITAERDGYAPGGGVVIASAMRSRTVDIGLVSLDIASVLTPTPPAVVFSRHRRIATVFLENPSRSPLGWSLESAPPWLELFSSSRIVYQGNPEVLELWVVGEDLMGEAESNVREALLLKDDDGRQVRIPLTARVLDPTRLSVEALGPDAFAASLGDATEARVRVLYDGLPVEGERVRCVLGEQESFVDVTVTAMTDASGEAMCRFTPDSTDQMPHDLSLRADMTAYPEVPGVEFVVRVAPAQ